jgi:hypothetical protein
MTRFGHTFVSAFGNAFGNAFGTPTLGADARSCKGKSLLQSYNLYCISWVKTIVNQAFSETSRAPKVTKLPLEPAQSLMVRLSNHADLTYSELHDSA